MGFKIYEIILRLLFDKENLECKKLKIIYLYKMREILWVWLVKFKLWVFVLFCWNKIVIVK